MNSKMIFASVLLLATPAAAQDGVRAQLGKCLAIPGVLQRLSCYDGVARGVAPAVVSAAPRAAMPYPSPVPGVAVNAPPQRAPSPAEGFGAEALPRTQAARQAVAEIGSAITDLSYTPTGKFVVTLANGQVWRQKEGDVSTKFFRKANRTATISRGFMGSYNLVFNNSGAYYKVTRVR